ncbi:MAG: thioesterase superfamily [Sphingomonas bacterium]|uniref:acyl-CoA thioesterase n=1 Tax=Sphingomonas bacterium TaxID=1895847 RepID=UPI0026391AC8|nr:acyl-CoA thioesterase [Sphingomonas bacterium]MDB5694549.1 thioesterase superfamily [Sphingomonas bacterium]
MPRPASWRLSPTAYPHTQAVQTRFQDLDVLGHLNNVAFAALFETARTKFNQQAQLWGLAGLRRRAVVAQMEINYVAEGQYPADVEIATGIGEIGGRSWQILAAMFQDGKPLATCDVVIVMDKDEDGGGLSDAFKAELAKWLVTNPLPPAGEGQP